MSQEENIFVAKRNIVDYIWKSANLEGISVTYPDTDAIYNGLSIQGYQVKDIVTINNLKRAWEFILDNLQADTDLDFICYINRIVGGDNLIYKSGELRSLEVRIGGTTWQPPIPERQIVQSNIHHIFDMDKRSITEQSIHLMLYLMRSQLFMDGNNRTAMLAANHLMIKKGKGIISIPQKNQPKFLELLIDFYESNINTTIKKYIHETSIDGIDFNRTKTKSHEPER